MREGHWSDGAACKDRDTEEFFVENSNGRAYRELGDMCESCPVAMYCRVSSLGEFGGFWAGLPPHHRQRFRSFWGVSDTLGHLAADGQRVAAKAWREEVTALDAARQWLGKEIGDAWMDWYAPTLNQSDYKEFYGVRQSA